MHVALSSTRLFVRYEQEQNLMISNLEPSYPPEWPEIKENTHAYSEFFLFLLSFFAVPLCCFLFAAACGFVVTLVIRAALLSSTNL